MGKYVRKSYEKFKEELGGVPSKEILDKKIKEEVTSGVQTLQYQINTLITTNLALASYLHNLMQDVLNNHIFHHLSSYFHQLHRSALEIPD